LTVKRGSQFSRHGGICVPVALVSGVPSALLPSKPSTLTRGTTITFSAARMVRDSIELFVSVRTRFTAESLVSISSPCCCATIITAVGPWPITTYGTSRPELLVQCASCSVAAP
jgi:hypothetical protein